MYVNANETAWILTMVETNANSNKTETVAQAGKRLYNANCMACHGPDKKGSGNNPTLIDISKKYSAQQISQLITSGRRMMPAQPSLTKEEKNAIISWVTENKMEQQKQYTGKEAPSNPYQNMPYNSTGYHKFLTADGYPAISPPWGTLNAINLHTGKLEWKIPLGEYPELTAKGIPPTGTENYGGPAVTAGGVLFIAASRDGKFRAFNKRTGQLLWQTDLPAPGFATPSVYSVNNKQYIVIACGGGKLKTHTADAYIAYALP
jgi:quinoprotein glucose dehydrogenase